MNNTAVTAIRMMAGSFTPYYLTNWGKEENDVVANFFKGAGFPSSLERFENEMAAKFGPGCGFRAVNSGRAGIQLVLEALQLPPGSDVLVPTMSHVGVAVAVIQAGHNPVFVDIDDNFVVRYESVMEAESIKVKAIILNYFNGCWIADMEKLLPWARQRGVWVIENCAQAQGLMHNGIPVGNFGDAAVFSAHGGSTILASGGGWIMSRNPKISDYVLQKELSTEPRDAVGSRILKLQDFSLPPAEQARKNIKDSVDPKKKGRLDSTQRVLTLTENECRFKMFTMSGVDARLILLQLKKLNAMLIKRREHAFEWQKGLQKLYLGAMRLPSQNENAFTKLMLTFGGPEGEAEAELLRSSLLANGIETEPAYIPLHKIPVFKEFRHTSMDFVEFRWRGAFNVPVRENLDEADWKRIHKALSAVQKSIKKK